MGRCKTAPLGNTLTFARSAGFNSRIASVDIPVSREEWDRFTNVNTKAVFFLSQAAGKVMVAQGEGGAIVPADDAGE